MKFKIGYLLCVLLGFGMGQLTQFRKPSVQSELPSAVPTPSALVESPEESPVVQKGLLEDLKILETKRSDERSVLSEVEKLNASGEPDRARALLEKAAREEPENGSYQKELGMMAARLGEGKKALNYLDKAIAQGQLDSEILNTLVDISVSSPDNSEKEEAEALLRRASEARPGEWEPLLGLAELEIQRGNHTESKGLLERAAQMQGGQEAARRKLAEVSLRENRFEDAISYYAQVIESKEKELEASRSQGNPTDYKERELDTIRLDYAMSLMANGQTKEAEEHVRGHLEKHPEDQVAQRLYADIQNRIAGQTQARGLPKRNPKPVR